MDSWEKCGLGAITPVQDDKCIVEINPFGDFNCGHIATLGSTRFVANFYEIFHIQNMRNDIENRYSIWEMIWDKSALYKLPKVYLKPFEDRFYTNL